MKIFFLIGITLIGLTQAKDWWENGNFYQIYPRSFKDSNGDGVGDLNGIAEKLPYLKEIGITGAWLSPIFKSPMVDFGYDIADYRVIHPEFGTMEDFKNLIKKAKEIGMKIFLDFVPNHTSDESEWFKKSVQRIEPYTDYYIWHDGIIDENGERKPPTNWVSAFRYSAWEWNEDRKQYYLHQFAIKQPDLNYRNPKVVTEMKNVIKFWLDIGVDGFRIDAVPYMFEIEADKNGNYPDEPVDPNCPNPDDLCHTLKIYTQNQIETFDMIYQWRELCDEYKKEHGGDTRILFTEAYTSLENEIKFYGDGKRNGSHVPFNFELISYTNMGSTATDFNKHIDSWLNNMPKDVIANWVLGNHDNHRLASRYGPARTDLFNIMLNTLPGNAITYNGEEIGMTDVWISWEDSVDPQACNTDPDRYYAVSRDPARTPFQWDASNLAGFSSSTNSWLPVAKNYTINNVLMQSRSPVSHLQVFKKLTKLRQEPAFQTKTLNEKIVHNNVLLYRREGKGDNYIIVLNFGKNSETINLKEKFPSITNKVEIITTSIQSKYTDGEIVDATKFVAEGEVGTVVVSV
ncbi:maltase A1-like [Condylostylus longicornis]|uniref:maltase A1-like n=1 Tax=Condylostylus longicornis TaxID=2530218 RepID=UPI00244DD0AD|nr:maltase A1-like [Condylostylus longicornis]